MKLTRTKRNVFLLAVCQALFLTATAAVMTFAAIVGKMLASYEGHATWPIAIQFGSMMGTTFIASMYMKRVGRKIGFITGASIGICGGIVATVGIFQLSFWTFCAGTAMIGSFNAFAHYLRFAAAEVSTPEYRSRAISFVLAGGVVAAVTGPNLAGLTKDLFAPVTYAGIFTAVIGLYVLLIATVWLVDFPRVHETERRGSGRPLPEILRQPKCIVAISSGVIGYLVMSFLMIVSPLAMVQCGLSTDDIPIVISGHILGMYAPSFVTGHLIQRYGVSRIMLAGAALQVLCISVNFSGIGLENFIVSMFLVGVGWNFLFVGGTTLLTECYAASERSKTQGVNDLCIWGSITIGNIVSGTAIHELGWLAVNLAVTPFILTTLVAVLWLRLNDRPRRAVVESG